VVETSSLVEPDPKTMSQSEIRAHNAKLARDDPFYIRCVRSEAAGSLVKRNVSCRTNRQWRLSEEAGNREARDVADAMRGKAVTSN
jgi:hypothetical protein